MNELRSIVKQYWGYDDLLPLQHEATASVLTGRDSLVVLPTGGGKSLCFQAPAMAMPGVAIVVSPLISLMKDQVESLTACGVSSAFLNSSQTFEERRAVGDRLRAGELKLLYVAPERLVTSQFLEALSRLKLSFIAVDEAHCVSMWGHDFRPEYRQLSILREKYPDLGIHAYTATATERVREDIINELRLRGPEVLVGSFDRPNLTYSVQRRESRLRQISSIIDRHKGESGIVYCIRRADVDDLNVSLCERGLKALPYHAGLDDAVRKRNQEAFIQEEVDIIVATVAFGMGIDKSNVRYVIHAGMPKSIEHYQQESGRAGRDGLPAECVLLYSYADVATWRFIIEKGDDDVADPAVQEIALRKLREMYDYCTSATCRHRALVGYFGQSLEHDGCNACDVCMGEIDVIEDALTIAQKIISCVVRLDERFGATYTTQILNGKSDERAERMGHTQLSTFGILSDRRPNHVRDWVEQLVAQGFLDKVGEYGTLAVTSSGREVLRSQRTPQLLKPAETTKDAKKTGIDAKSWQGVDRGLFEELRILRRAKATELSVPPFVIFSDASLRDMARRRPSTKEAFLHVYGVGRKKAEDFAPQFLASIRRYCEENSLELDAVVSRFRTARPSDDEDTPEERGPKTGRGRLTERAAFEMFREGRALDEVAEVMARSRNWVVEKLARFIEGESRISPEPWLDLEVFQRVREAAIDVGIGALKPLYVRLDEAIPYDDIRIAVACLKNFRAMQERAPESHDSP